MSLPDHCAKGVSPSAAQGCGKPGGHTARLLMCRVDCSAERSLQQVMHAVIGVDHIFLDLSAIVTIIFTCAPASNAYPEWPGPLMTAETVLGIVVAESGCHRFLLVVQTGSWQAINIMRPADIHHLMTDSSYLGFFAAIEVRHKNA